ncbi:MAG: hypothetical protein ACR2QE_13370 [Acidimicrobiales bacterium]
MTTIGDTEWVASLLDLLLTAVGDAPVAVGVTLIDDAAELHVRPLPEPDPTGGLIGWRAPPHWAAFAIVAPARCRSAPPHRSVDGVAHLVTRTELAVTRLSTDGRPADHRMVAEGWIPDLCRRVLALPTDPAATTTAHLLAVTWLDRILVDVIEGDLDHPRPDWDRCRELLGTTCPLPDHRLGGLGAAFADRWPWAAVRASALERPHFGLTPAQARWFDAGSFSRYVLSGFALVDELLDDVTELVSPDAAPRLCAVIEQWLEH